MSITKEEISRLKCEKLLNESWSQTDNFYNELRIIVMRGYPESDREEAVLMIAGTTALQKLTLDNADEGKCVVL